MVAQIKVPKECMGQRTKTAETYLEQNDKIKYLNVQLSFLHRDLNKTSKKLSRNNEN